MTATDVYLPTTPERALPLVTIPAGRCVPVFSSQAALLAARPEGGPYLRVTRRALPSLCPEGVGVLFDGAVALTAEAAADLVAPLIGEPKEEPLELLAALRAFLDDRVDVLAAHRAALIPPAGPPVTAVGFAVHEGADEEAVVSDAAEAVARAGLERVVFSKLGDGDGVARHLRRTEPFYRAGPRLNR